MTRIRLPLLASPAAADLPERGVVLPLSAHLDVSF